MGKPLDKSISIDKLNLSIIDVIDQSIKLDTHMLAKFQSYRFYQFIRFVEQPCSLVKKLYPLMQHLIVTF